MSNPAIDLAVVESERARIRAAHLRPAGDRPESSARGLHHVACLSSDVERTVRFYQDVLEFPLTDLFENRDYRGSNHFFFDIGNGNLLAFFDFPGLDLGPYAEVLGGLHHIAISVPEQQWHEIKGRLDERKIEYFVHSGSSIYTSDATEAFRFRRGVSAGMVSVNNSTSGAEAHLPFGGNGKSGNGSRQSGQWVLDQFTRWQALNWDYSGRLQKAQMDVAELTPDRDFRLRGVPGGPPRG